MSILINAWDIYIKIPNICLVKAHAECSLRAKKRTIKKGCISQQRIVQERQLQAMRLKWMGRGRIKKSSIETPKIPLVQTQW
jgi:hypothetical protein